MPAPETTRYADAVWTWLEARDEVLFSTVQPELTDMLKLPSELSPHQNAPRIAGPVVVTLALVMGIVEFTTSLHWLSTIVSTFLNSAAMIVTSSPGLGLVVLTMCPAPPAARVFA